MKEVHMIDSTPQTEKKGLPPALQSMLRSMAGDMKFVGILTIISGAISCLTIIGAAIGIPYIFAGIRLKDSAATFESYAVSADAGRLKIALELQAKYFRILKILILVGLGLAALYVLFLIVIVGMALGS